jgi:hypothetical protein
MALSSMSCRRGSTHLVGALLVELLQPGAPPVRGHGRLRDSKKNKCSLFVLGSQVGKLGCDLSAERHQRPTSVITPTPGRPRRGWRPRRAKRFYLARLNSPGGLAMLAAMGVQAGETIMQLRPDWSRPLPQTIVIPTVTTLRTLADVRVLIQYLPEDRRDNPTWRHVAAQLEQAAAGVDVVDLGIALRLALMLEGLEYEAPQ